MGGTLRLDGPVNGYVFWLEIKGPKTPVSRDQVRWWYRTIAAGVPVFCVRHPQDLEAVFEEIGFQRPLPTGAPRLDVGGVYSRESDVQRDVKAILELYGFDVTDTSQGYRPGGRRHGTTRITRGTPDLFVTRPPKHEVRLEPAA